MASTGAAQLPGTGVPGRPAPDGEPPVVLAARGLSKRFGGLQAIDGVDLVLRAGCVLGIIGPNGAGKSTLVNLLSGLYRADAGTVELAGRDVSRADLAALSRQGLLRTFQHTKVLSSFTVAQAIDLARRSPRGRVGSGRDTAGTFAEEFGLGEVLHRRVTELPYGTQKVLNLCLIAMAAPIVVLLDEPFAGVTRADIERLSRVMERLLGAGAAIGLVEHDMPALMKLSTTVLVLDSGRVVTEGPPARIQNDEQVRRIYLGRRRGEEASP
jgi:ABC-type branched-subunit amino acid transport system ATPase component